MAGCDDIKRKSYSVNGINMNVAEKGEGPVVLFLHGFPEFWYSWRHQIHFLSDHGYRAIAPDLRGFGETDAPAGVANYTYFHVIGDLVALLDLLGIDKVFLVGHDWGAMIAWFMCMIRPDRVTALVNMSVALGVFGKWSPDRWPVEDLRAYYGDDYYIYRFQPPGEMEEEIAQVGGAAKLIGKVFPLLTPTWLLPKGEWSKDILPRPSWISEEEFDSYVTQYNKSGFTGGFNYYRAIQLNWRLIGPWNGAKVMVPTKFVVGSLDLAFRMPGVKEYIFDGQMEKDVPLMEEVVVMDEVGHFIQQEQAERINNIIYEFISKF